MASQSGQSTSDLNALFDELNQAPYSFDFFDLLRRLDCFNPGQPRIGHSVLPKQDNIRLGQEPSLKFAPAALAHFQKRPNAAPLLRVYFLGLLGPNGPLPLHLTEYIDHRRRHARDETPAAFLDLFHHRILSLFYRAWADAEPTVQSDRPDEDHFSFYLASLCGLGTDLMHRDHWPDQAKLHFAVYLGAQVKTPAYLENMIAAYFKVKVRLIELIGEWLPLPEDSLADLSRQPILGQNCTIGRASWQSAYRFRIQIYDLDWSQYERFLPVGADHQPLIDLVRNLIGLSLAWDLNLVLKRAAVPPAQLNQSRLGWGTWLHNRARQKDGDELILNLGVMNDGN